MISFEIISDSWILVLTALTAYLIITRQNQPRPMTPSEYDEWLLHNEEPDVENPLTPPEQLVDQLSD